MPGDWTPGWPEGATLIPLDNGQFTTSGPSSYWLWGDPDGNGLRMLLVRRLAHRDYVTVSLDGNYGDLPVDPARTVWHSPASVPMPTPEMRAMFEAGRQKRGEVRAFKPPGGAK